MLTFELHSRFQSLLHFVVTNDVDVRWKEWLVRLWHTHFLHESPKKRCANADFSWAETAVNKAVIWICFWFKYFFWKYIYIYIIFLCLFLIFQNCKYIFHMQIFFHFLTYNIYIFWKFNIYFFYLDIYWFIFLLEFKRKYFLISNLQNICI